MVWCCVVLVWLVASGGKACVVGVDLGGLRMWGCGWSGALDETKSG